MLVWASRIGFDLTDEGFYYLTASDWKYYANMFTQFGPVLHGIMGVVAGKVWLARIVTVLLSLASSWVLWRGACEWLGDRAKGWLPVLLLWSLAGFVWLPVALSYNTLNGMAASAWMGLWLWQKARPSGWRCLGLFVIAALAIAGKPTTGLCLLACSGLAVLPRPFAISLLKLGIALLVLVIVAGFVIHWRGPSSEAQSATSTATPSLQSYLANQQFLGLIGLTGKSVLALLWLWLPLSLVPLVIALGYRRTVKASDADAIAQARWAGALAAVFTSCVYFSVQRSLAKTVSFMFFGADQLSLVLLAFILALAAAPKAKASMADAWPELALLALVPFFGWIGTHNPIEINALFQIAPWVLLALLLADRVAGLPACVLPVALSVFVSLMLWLGVVEHPYRLAKPRYEQTKPTKLNDGNNIVLLDGRTSSLINQTRTLLKGAGFKPRDPVLAFYHLPGLVYAIGARSPGLAWYSNFQGLHEGTGVDITARNAQALLDLPLAELQRCYILQTPGAEAFIEPLKQRGLHFPEDYTLLGKVPLPAQMVAGELSVWQPKGTAQP